MTKAKAILILIMTLAIVAGVFFIVPPAAAADPVKDITLQPGRSESEINVCWQSVTGASPVVYLAEYDPSATAFPSDARRFKGTAAPSAKGWYANNVTVTGLQPETDYIYKVGSGADMSGPFRFTTGSGSSYSVLFVSDAQLGASGSISADKTAWEKTLSAALGKFPDIRFILSAGDQVDYYLESEYDAFLSSPLLRQYPVAAAVGNHENLGKSPLHSYYYNEPNQSQQYGVTPAGGDYWFRCGSALYLVLNTNITDVTQHDAFIAQAKAANADAGWTVLMFHQSIYSSAVYASSSSILSLRKNLVPVIDKYDIDVVLSGHDHCYTRTYQMRGGSIMSVSSDAQGRIVNPQGTVYITANSASGSKYYDMKATPEAYAAVRYQPQVPTFTTLDVTDAALTLTTYRTDTMQAIDTYAIVKTSAAGFADVPDGTWYAAAVAYLSANRLVTGTSQTTFSPDMTLTRAQCLVFIMKAFGLTPDAVVTQNFSDAGSTWYTGWLAAAKRLGLAKGGGNNMFLPEASITRQDMCVLIYNTLAGLNKLPAAGAPPLFNDFSQVSSYAKTAVDTLAACGAVSGSGGNISPMRISTRAQMAQVLYRLLTLP